jgi:hypothetical protein
MLHRDWTTAVTTGTKVADHAREGGSDPLCVQLYTVSNRGVAISPSSGLRGAHVWTPEKVVTLSTSWVHLSVDADGHELLLRDEDSRGRRVRPAAGRAAWGGTSTSVAESPAWPPDSASPIAVRRPVRATRCVHNLAEPRRSEGG